MNLSHLLFNYFNGNFFELLPETLSLFIENVQFATQLDMWLQLDSAQSVPKFLITHYSHWIGRSGIIA